jgi:hypothetical protein
MWCVLWQVSTTMFEIFNCKQIYLDSSSDLDTNIAPFWNVNDKSIQCFVGNHWMFMETSIVMTIFYALGWHAWSSFSLSIIMTCVL